MRRPLYPKRLPIKPRPVPEHEDVRDALAYVLASFGINIGRERAASATERSRNQARRLLDGPSYARRYTSELQAATRMIHVTASRVRRELRCVPMPAPGRYEGAWIDIIEQWNAHLIENDFAALPTLCEGCGVPVLLRGKNGKPSRVCGSPKCLDASKQRKKRKAKKLTGD